jgi:hypothetical protein
MNDYMTKLKHYSQLYMFLKQLGLSAPLVMNSNDVHNIHFDGQTLSYSGTTSW